MCIILLVFITNLWKDLKERVRNAKQFAHHHPPGMWRGWDLNPGSPTILNHYKWYFKINKDGTSRAGSYSLCPVARGTRNREYGPYSLNCEPQQGPIATFSWTCKWKQQWDISTYPSETLKQTDNIKCWQDNGATETFIVSGNRQWYNHWEKNVSFLIRTKYTP